MERIMCWDAASPWKPESTARRDQDRFSADPGLIRRLSKRTRSPFSPLIPTGPCYSDGQR